MEYILVIKNSVLQSETTLMDLEDIMLSEINQRRERQVLDITYVWNLKNLNCWKQNRWCFPGA